VRVLPAGPRAFLVEVDERRDVRRLYHEVLQRRAVGGLDDLVDVVPGASSVLLHFANEEGARLADEVPGWTLPAVTAQAERLVTIPVRYDGPDLAEVARLAGLSMDDVVAAHSGAELQVAFCGFCPGFAYLTGLPESLHVPRRPEPRTAVPARAVGIAAEFTAIYPQASPGGWHLIGTALVDPWDEHRSPPALLEPGDQVRFVVR
jgi:KipI family sensor histidine kinase inhibitor